MELKKILTDDEIHEKAIGYVDSVTFYKGAQWARECIEQKLKGNADDKVEITA